MTAPPSERCSRPSGRGAPVLCVLQMTSGGCGGKGPLRGRMLLVVGSLGSGARGGCAVGCGHTPPSTLHITAACTAHVCTLAHTRAHAHTHTQSAACTVNVCCLVSEPKWKVAIFVCIGKCGPSSNSAMLNSFIFWGCYSHSSLYMQGRSPLETRPVRFEWPGQSFPLPLRGSNDLT